MQRQLLTQLLSKRLFSTKSDAATSRRGNGKAFWRKASGMEIFRITLNITLPFLAAYIYANPEVMNKLILKFKFVEYPESGPIPVAAGDYVESGSEKKGKQRID
mmetsp:Transcript_21152/g.15475  ORF Transcript_21152/g.15475 Transcript_21152/m.15475 type:complete len:104 (+) Transcript_21152:30-341(+)